MLTYLIIALTALISVLAFSNEKLKQTLLLYPAGMSHPAQWYRLLTAGFVHADYMHLLFNMITFYFFGGIVAQFLGGELMLLMYLSGIIVSCLPSMIKHRQNPAYRSLGASGGVAAVVFAMIYMAPWEKIYLFFAIGIPSIVFAVAYLIYTGYMAGKGRGTVNHDAHLWGSVYGFVFMLIIDPSHGRYFIDQLLTPKF